MNSTHCPLTMRPVSILTGQQFLSRQPGDWKGVVLYLPKEYQTRLRVNKNLVSALEDGSGLAE